MTDSTRHCVTVKFFIEDWCEDTPAATAELLGGCLEEEMYECSVISYEDVTDNPNGGYQQSGDKDSYCYRERDTTNALSIAPVVEQEYTADLKSAL